MALRKYAEALNLYAAVVKQFPQGGGEYGRAAADAGDFDLAVRVWGKFLGYQPESAGLLMRLADEYQSIGLHAKACDLLVSAASLEPRNLELRLKLASFLARTGGIDQARAAVGQCLELDPLHEQARFLAAHLDRREGRFADAERQLRSLLAPPAGDLAVRYSCHAELAWLLDRMERFDEAMDVLAEGKRLARLAFHQEAERKAFYERHEMEVRQAKALPNDILDTWAGVFPARARTAPVPLAFLSGSARSGTTLLERILDAHPAVAACDESPAFKTVQAGIDVGAPVIPAPRLNLLRQRYVKNLMMTLGPSAAGAVLLDKNPSRTVWLPAFLRVFPELRVLIALRDPRDIMISLFFQDHVMTNYLTLAQLAEHYCRVMGVWLAVREWKGLAWMETRYEDTVADLQKEGSRVTQFLGLSWHENQTRFYEKNREKPVMSTNYTDVTQPVYTRSVGRWRAYEKHLAPVLPALEPYCKMFGYA
jgi:Flp pilus assembly protein TadD